MYRGLSVLGLIPARAGSKGIPGKNIRPLAGKPLIVYSIEAARESGAIDYLLVSTDGEDIAHIARQVGAEVPFMRPAKLASDNARGMDVLYHAMSWLEERGKKYDCVITLQPTSPLRTAEDITKAMDLLIEHNADAIVSVCKVDHHPWWCNTLPEDGCMKDFLKPGIPSNRQELPCFYRINGAIYLARWDYIRNRDNWYGPGTYAYVMPRDRSVDIDDEVDLRLATLLLKQ
ncbi:cytidylyltransferase domain-containing protein [Desulfotomaculum copahuensis]|uniref:CMP-N-acetlyneuraminic acid synthetase n=1 Tax=Desulfotomaculum copahuensis TaxID=1838280 RepID=A0A1B7LCF0_9FIRM|nr:acylneuraminate cytidylyltransferase family protein [Desulfotomaculum copahuensis]OAT80388.1 CMP-N-acetlyneuraminic acid synthetase [Desulfotomaculum copahuensis]